MNTRREVEFRKLKATTIEDGDVIVLTTDQIPSPHTLLMMLQELDLMIPNRKARNVTLRVDGPNGSIERA